MRTRWRSGVAVAATGATVALTAVPALGAPAGRSLRAAHRSASPPVRVVHVRDDYFTPDKLTVRPGTKIRWVWASDNYDTHNVTLVRAPRSVNRRHFTSIDGTSGIVFTRVLTVLGSYHFQCTIHPATMNMTIVVKR